MRSCCATTPRSWPTAVRPGDVVVLHDPQTAGLAAAMRRRGARVIWRCHIGTETMNDRTAAGWGFLRRYLEPPVVDAYVFSRRGFAPSWMPDEQVRSIPPSIDPFSPKNQELSTDDVQAILGVVGLVGGDGRRRRLPSSGRHPPRHRARRRRASHRTACRPPTCRWSSRSPGGTGSRTWWESFTGSPTMSSVDGGMPARPGRAGRDRRRRRSGRRPGAAGMPRRVASPAAPCPPAGGPRVPPDGRRRGERHHRERPATSCRRGRPRRAWPRGSG